MIIYCSCFKQGYVPVCYVMIKRRTYFLSLINIESSHLVDFWIKTMVLVFWYISNNMRLAFDA